MATNTPPVDPQIVQMVYGWIDNYIANTRKLVPFLETGFGEWMQKNTPKVQNLQNFATIGKEFSNLINKNLEFKIGGRTRTNDPAKFNTIWDTWEQMITQRTIMLENDANARKDVKNIALTRCLKLVTKTVHDEVKDEKQLAKVLADMLSDLYKDVKSITKK